MWTRENRGLYERKGVRYPSDLRDEEWALIAPLIPPAKRDGRRREVDVREVMNGVLYVLGTGCQWRALPKDLPPKSTVHDYLMLWDTAAFTTVAYFDRRASKTSSIPFNASKNPYPLG